MTYREIAIQIPDVVRSKRLLTESNPILNAVPVQTDYNMNLLYEVWYAFIEPGATKKINCPICLQNILNGFTEMYGELLQLEKEYQLLNSI